MRRWLTVAVLVVTLAGEILCPSFSFGQNWQDYSPSERYEALRNFRRHQELPRDAQRDVEQKYQRWQNLPEGDRDKIRRNYDRYRDMPPGERDQFERKYRTWRRGQPQQ
jgi:hypothetical protein